MQVMSYAQGTPSWFELSTNDEAAAVRFYDALFGWRDTPNPVGEGMGEYHMQKLGDADVGAISALQPDETAQGVPPHWSVRFSVDDVDTSVDQVRAAGRLVLAESFDVMEFGRIAVVADPTGAPVWLWQTGTHAGAGVMHKASSVTWAELMTTDARRAATFFDQALGHEVQIVPPERETDEYILLRVANEDVAGIVTMTPEMDEHPPSWMIYFEVDDADRNAERAQQLGGEVVQPPADIAPSRFAVLHDPQDAVFGMIRSAPLP